MKTPFALHDCNHLLFCLGICGKRPACRLWMASGILPSSRKTGACDPSYNVTVNISDGICDITPIS